MDVALEFGSTNLINIMLTSYFNTVRGSDGISMINGPPSFENHVGFGRFVYRPLFFDLFNKKNIHECRLLSHPFLAIDLQGAE